MDASTQSGLSRPKVHRLPDISREPVSLPKIFLVGCLALLLVAVIPAAAFIKSKSSTVHALLKTNGTTPAQAMVAPLDSALLVRDDKGQVVGQMARIPVDAGQGMSVNTTKNVDGTTSKELLSIIGKY